MNNIVEQANSILAERGVSGLVPVLAVIGVATACFYSVITVDKILKISKGGARNG